MMFSTDPDRLLVLEAWAGHGACRVGAEHREILRYSLDVVVYVEYWSRTLTAGSQLCKECTHSSLWRSRVCRRKVAKFDHSCFQPSVQCGGEYGQFGQQRAMVKVVKRSDTLIPLSTNHP